MLLLLGMTAVKAQDITVNGTVVSAADDEPLIGVTVMAVGSSHGVATDIDGAFQITVPAGTDLRFSYVGYDTQIRKAEPEMHIRLMVDEALLDEVVVVGYTTQRKADLTGAVAVMNMKEPISENASSIVSSMQGKLPGVQVTTDAAPGGSGTIRVRGMSTVNSNDPLYIVDGVATTTLDGINPSDIESLQVLKDAASASIYGARAANGVIIVTTKSGRGEKMTVNINYAASLQTRAKTFKMLNADQWGLMYYQACQNSGVAFNNPLYSLVNGVPTLNQYIAGSNVPTTDTDWQDAVYRSAWTNNLTASITNNTEKGSYVFSTNYINQDGLMDYTFYRRYSARLNTRYDFNKYITVGENLMVAYWQNRGYGTNDDRGIPYTAMRQHPALPIYTPDGDWALPMGLISSDIANPVQTLYNGRDNSSTSWRILGNAYLEVHPIEGLSLKSNIGIEHSQYFNKNLNRKTNPTDNNGTSREFGEGDTWTWTNTANYVNTFNDVHHVNALFGVEAIKYTYNNVYAERLGYAFETDNFMQIDAGTGNVVNGGNKSQWGLFSVFGKADYNYMDRYLASFTIRRDQSSRLAKHHNSGVFPAFTLAWRPTQEDFFPKNEWLNDLKIRFAWGQNGNSAISNLYASYTTFIYDRGNGAYDIDGTNTGQTAGIIQGAKGNPDLKWETTTQTNIGFDMALIKNAVTLSFDYYWKKTKDMLTIPPVLSAAGQNAAMWMNTGDMDNKGWEITLNYISPRYGDFSWNGGINFSAYRNKLVKLNSSVHEILGDVAQIVGQPLGVYYGYVCDGIFQNADQVANHAYQQGAAPGRLIYRDLNGDGTIDDSDRCIIGNPNPDFSMGLNLDFKYKDFTLSTFFSGEFGFDIINYTKRQLDFMGSGILYTNRGADIMNAWTPTNTNTDIPAVALADNNNEQRFSTYYTSDGSYFKMKYIKLAYNLPENICRAVYAQQLSVYAQLENVFTITKYKGLDPELPYGSFGARIDNAPYPRSRVFTLGVNLTF